MALNIVFSARMSTAPRAAGFHLTDLTLLSSNIWRCGFGDGRMPLSDDQLRDIVRQLVRRPGHEDVRSDIRDLFVHLGLSLDEIRFEANLVEIRGRVDALLANTVFEFKSDLRREQEEAERQLTRYLADRESFTGRRFVGVATDGLDFIAYELRHGKLSALRNRFNLRNVLKV
jgi:hypothetical protein